MKKQLKYNLSLQQKFDYISSFELVRLDELSGEKCCIYSVRINDEDNTQFEQFLDENYNSFKEEALDIFTRLKAIGKSVGLRHGFYRHNKEIHITDDGFEGDLNIEIED